MYKLILNHIKSSSRRVSVQEELDSSVIVYHIRGAIYLFHLSNKQYFTRTMIKDYLNEQIGWPKLNDKKSVSIFNDIFQSVACNYLPSSQIRGGYSFNLISSPSNKFTDKVLKGN